MTLAVPLASHPILSELELRMRTHAGALSRYYLDALLGLVPIRTHGAERPLRREHGRVMHEWLRSGVQLLRASVAIEAVQVDARLRHRGLAAAVAPLARRRRQFDPAAHWAMQVPVLGDELALLVRQYPIDAERDAARARAAADADVTRSGTGQRVQPLAKPATAGVRIVMDGVEVRAAGHSVLHGVSVSIPAGAHVAVVGASGAGKSTLVGLLLGWYARPQDSCWWTASHSTRRLSMRCAG